MSLDGQKQSLVNYQSWNSARAAVPLISRQARFTCQAYAHDASNSSTTYCRSTIFEQGNQCCTSSVCPFLITVYYESESPSLPLGSCIPTMPVAVIIESGTDGGKRQELLPVETEYNILIFIASLARVRSFGRHTAFTKHWTTKAENDSKGASKGLSVFCKSRKCFG